MLVISLLSCALSVAHAADTIPTPFWVERFTLPDNTISDTGATAWSVSNTSPSRKSIFAVDSNEFRANDITINGEGTWTSGPIDISGKLSVRISVDARSAGGLTNDPTNHADYLKMYYRIDGGDTVLFADQEGKINNNRTTDTTLSVGTPRGATLRIIIKAKATATSEFYFFDNVIVSGVTPVLVNASATVSGNLTCVRPSVTLSGSSTTPGVSYHWSGPGGFSADVQNPMVSASGVYTLTVTNPEGLFGTATVAVSRNINAPIGVTAGATDVITCFTPSVFITGSSTTAGATWQWTGPDGFTATTNNAEAAQAGTYTLTVTNPVNGCTTTATAIVEDNTTPPAGVLAANSGVLNCLNTTVTLTGSAVTTGVAYTWVAPDQSSVQGDSIHVSVAGTYTLVVTDAGNGCASIATTTVLQNTTGCAGGLAVITPTYRIARRAFQ